MEMSVIDEVAAEEEETSRLVPPVHVENPEDYAEQEEKNEGI